MSGAQDEGWIFPSRARRREFFARIEAVIDDFPELLEGLDIGLRGCVDNDGQLYDPDEPKLLAGLVLVLHQRTLSGWDGFTVVDPEPQSSLLTAGLIAAAHGYVSSPAALGGGR